MMRKVVGDGMEWGDGGNTLMKRSKWSQPMIQRAVAIMCVKNEI